MTLQTPEILTRIEQLRDKGRRNELTLEDMREGIKLLRNTRLSAAQQSKSGKAKAPPRSAEDMLADL